jgi:hypothetical protein
VRQVQYQIEEGPIAGEVIFEGYEGASTFDPRMRDGGRCYPGRGVFGEYLYLRPGGDRIGYAVPIDGAITPPGSIAPIQIGPEASVDNSYASGYRVGFQRMFGCDSSLTFAYAALDSSFTDQVTTDIPFVLRSLVAHPGTESSATEFVVGSARSDIDFKLADISFARSLVRRPSYWINWQAGLRYGKLQRQFGSILANSILEESVETEVNYDGGGFRFGLSAGRHISLGCATSPASDCGCPDCRTPHGWSLYGNAFASFLGGSFRTHYVQRDNFTTDPIVDTGWKEERIVPILDVEFGCEWISRNQRWRLHAGYLFSAWYNVVNTDEFIDGVRQNLSTEIAGTLTFDGLKAGAEFRF